MALTQHQLCFGRGILCWATHVSAVLCKVLCKSTPSRLLCNDILKLPVHREGKQPATGHTANIRELGVRPDVYTSKGRALSTKPHCFSHLNPSDRHLGLRGSCRELATTLRVPGFTSEQTSTHNTLFCFTTFLAFFRVKSKPPPQRSAVSQDRFPKRRSPGQRACASSSIFDLQLTKLILGQLVGQRR